MWASAVISIGIIAVIMTMPSALGQCFGEADGDGKLEDPAKFVDGTTKFGLDLLTIMQDSKSGLVSNVVLSPVSVWLSLTNLWYGAGEDTKEQLKKALNLGSSDQKQVRLFQKGLMAGLKLDQASMDHVQLKLANRAYVDRGVTLNECIIRYMKPEVAQLSMVSKPEEAQQSINQWIDEQTGNGVSKILPADYVHEKTSMAVVNAGFLKASWTQRSVAPNGEKRSFFLSPNNTEEVIMYRHLPGTYQHAVIKDLGCNAFDVPFEGKQVRLVVLLPDDNLETSDVISKLNVSNLKSVFGTSKTSTTDLWMPLMHLKIGPELKGYLRELGIERLFQQDANLSGFSAKSIPADFVRHKSRVDLYGPSTEGKVGQLPEVSPNAMVIDRPFVFLIVHKWYDVVLFLGILRDP